MMQEKVYLKIILCYLNLIDIIRKNIMEALK